MFETTVQLAAIFELPADELVGRFWNCKDDGGLAERVAPQDRFELGDTRAMTPEEPRSPGPAGHVVDLISYLGTIDGYTLPKIDDALIERVTDAFRQAPAEDALASAEPVQLEGFLQARRGMYLLFEG